MHCADTATVTCTASLQPLAYPTPAPAIPFSLKPRQTSYSGAPAPRPPPHGGHNGLLHHTTYRHHHHTLTIPPSHHHTSHSASAFTPRRRPRHRPPHRHPPLRLLRPPRRRLHCVHRALPPGVQARPAHEDVQEAHGGRPRGSNGGSAPGARAVAPGGAYTCICTPRASRSAGTPAAMHVGAHRAHAWCDLLWDRRDGDDGDATQRRARAHDFLKGLKENIIIGNLIPAGTGPGS